MVGIVIIVSLAPLKLGQEMVNIIKCNVITAHAWSSVNAYKLIVVDSNVVEGQVLFHKLSVWIWRLVVNNQILSDYLFVIEVGIFATKLGYTMLIFHHKFLQFCIFNRIQCLQLTIFGTFSILDLYKSLYNS